MTTRVKNAAKSWKQRWRLVNELERRQTRAMPMSMKYRQFLDLMEFGRTLRWPKRLDREIEQVRGRWQRLSEHYRGQAQA
jgi:hypothetical protein